MSKIIDGVQVLNASGARYVRLTFNDAAGGTRRRWAVELPEGGVFQGVDRLGDSTGEILIGTPSDSTAVPAGISLRYGWMVTL